jgi:cobalt/nickel transport system permease protein
MQIRFGLPPVTDSPLARLDARGRLLALVAWMIALACLRTLSGAVLGLCLSLCLAAFARMDRSWFLARLVAIGLLLAVFVLPVPLLSREPWSESVPFAIGILFKALALFTLSATLLVTAPLQVTMKAAHALWVPGLLIQLFLLSYRYLFVLGDELARLRIALRVRGFRNRMNARSYHTIAAASGTLLVRGYERSERITAAMRCRGFDGQFRALVEFHTRAIDVVTTLGMLLGAIGLVALDVYLRS